MPGRFIVFILLLLIIGTFIGFNIGFTSDIRIWFGSNGVLTDVPILLSLFIVYLAGLLSSIPFIIFWNIKQKEKKKRNESFFSEIDEEPDSKPTRILGANRSKADEDE